MKKALLAAVASLLTMAFYAAPAAAQATRTWVSGVGDDVNPCSRTAPCKTFAGAISKTAAGGIINCLDPGGFGTLTVTKSITIDCVSTQAGMLASGVPGVTINAGANDKVVLRNLSIEGAGTTQGSNGVNILSAATVIVDNCRIWGFKTSTAAGIRVAATANTIELHVKDSIISDNGIGGTGGGIVFNSTGVLARAVLSRVELRDNAYGILGITGGAAITGMNVVIAGSANDGIKLQAPSGSSSVFLDMSLVSGNVGNGVSVDNNTAGIFARSTIADNGTGLNHVGTGALYTYGNNQVSANGVQGNFTNSLPIQ